MSKILVKQATPQMAATMGSGGPGISFLLGGGSMMTPQQLEDAGFGEIGSPSHDFALDNQRRGHMLRYGLAGLSAFNSAYNQTSTCLYKNTLDAVGANDEWAKKEKALKGDGMKAAEIAFEKKNWYLLEANRIFIPDSFDYVIKSVGIYENKELIKKACDVLINSFTHVKQAVETDDSTVVSVKPSKTTIANCFDVTLHGYDYTVGKVMEYFLYVRHYEGDKMLSYCGFNKEHPHDTHSILRLGYKNQSDTAVVKQFLGEALASAITTFVEINDEF